MRLPLAQMRPGERRMTTLPHSPSSSHLELAGLSCLKEICSDPAAAVVSRDVDKMIVLQNGVRIEKNLQSIPRVCTFMIFRHSLFLASRTNPDLRYASW